MRETSWWRNQTRWQWIGHGIEGGGRSQRWMNESGVGGRKMMILQINLTRNKAELLIQGKGKRLDWVNLQIQTDRVIQMLTCFWKWWAGGRTFGRTLAYQPPITVILQFHHFYELLLKFSSGIPLFNPVKQVSTLAVSLKMRKLEQWVAFYWKITGLLINLIT